MSAAGCQTGTPVLCHAHNGTPKHTTGTGFVLFSVKSAIYALRDAIISKTVHNTTKVTIVK